ncbi:unnamed protein product [Aspergillus oryzae]|nr:hypothetical protein NYO67_9241 [Aspergillus flavus]QMW37854.1 hypothetical protein G4B11_001090 [Aspergillus flavus]GMF80844.1 unnamed protein product [Aspergillus oryzae]GMF87032.1 unnamed protein product [Aspergillus oryzae]
MEEPEYKSRLTGSTASPREESDLCLYVPTHEQPSTVEAAHLFHRNSDHTETSSTHGDTHVLAQDCGYNSSASSTERSSSDFLGGDLDYEELRDVNSRASSRSSISSIPASVLTNPISRVKSAVVRRSQQDMLSPSWGDHNENEHGEMEEQLRLTPTVRKHHSAFRKSSSVRALQMHTEDEGDGEYLTPPKRRGGHRMSDGSSQLKRSPYYSPTGLVAKQKSKKDYPLVLLHCNLLPPSLPIPGLVDYPDQKILREVLPSEYWKRWKLLEEKIGSVVLRERGVLISHPEDMYDLLEERLLESLELQRPRFDHGHFLGHEEADTDRDSQSMAEESATDDEQGEQCLDCGGRVVRHSETGRKWEIRVFAANGLMRAGAWAAAWREMEKVDVEVGLWLPSEVRRELEKRLLEGELSRPSNRLQAPQLKELVNDKFTKVHTDPAHSQASLLEVDRPKLLTARRVERSRLSPAPEKTAPQEHHRQSGRPSYPRSPAAEIELQTLLVNYIRVLASDRRNVAIALLTVLVVFFALNTRPTATPAHVQPFPPDMLEMVSRSTISPLQHSSAIWENPTWSMNKDVTTSEVRAAAVSAAHQHLPTTPPSQPMSSDSTTLQYGDASEVGLAKPEKPSSEAEAHFEGTTTVASRGVAEKSSSSAWPLNPAPAVHPALSEAHTDHTELTETAHPVGEALKNGGEVSSAILVI